MASTASVPAPRRPAPPTELPSPPAGGDWRQHPRSGRSRQPVASAAPRSARPAITPSTLTSVSRTRSSARSPRGPTPCSRGPTRPVRRGLLRAVPPATRRPPARTDSAVAAISVPSTPRATGASRSWCSRSSAERGVKLGERPALQRGAQPVRVPGSDPQLVGSALTGELRVQGRRERRLVGDDEAGRVGGKRREAAEDPDHARDHREAVDRQRDAPAGSRRGGSLRIGEHRDGVRVGWLRRPEHAGRSARGEGDARDVGRRPVRCWPVRCWPVRA